MRSTITSLPELKDRRFVFHDRAHAGRVLAEMIRREVPENGILLGIPAGGVPVGLAISRILTMAFDVAVVSKITLPWNTEAGYGAVAFDGTIRLNEMLLGRLNLKTEEMQAGIEKTRKKVARRIHTLRGGQPFPDLGSRTAILVDDGLASGFTMFCAIDALKNSGARNIIVAVPTAHIEAAEAVAQMVDRVYCANIRGGLSFAVAEAYEHWYDVTDEELNRMLGNTPLNPPSRGD